MLRRLVFLSLCAAACASAPRTPRIASQPVSLGAHRYRGTRPNILIIFTDDHGYGDVGFLNPAVKETAAIDALAAGGIAFTDMHTFPLCTPSRAQLLTGRVSTRTGVTTNFVQNSLYGLPRSEHTIAELLKPAGYDTVQLGKWRESRRSGWRGALDDAACRRAHAQPPPPPLPRHPQTWVRTPASTPPTAGLTSR